jgi:lipopolysaccharide export system permease protein
VETASDDGRTLHDLHIYRRDASSNLKEEVSATLAVAEPGGWKLHGAVTLTVGQDRSTPSAPADQDWKTALRPGDIVRIYREGDRVSVGVAAISLARAAPTDRSPGYYLTRVNRTFAEPLAAIVMLLLSAPAALSSLRSDQAMRLFVFGLSSGILFLVADGLLTALGESSALPPLLAAWSAPVAFTALAVTVLLYAEG